MTYSTTRTVNVTNYATQEEFRVKVTLHPADYGGRTYPSEPAWHEVDEVFSLTHQRVLTGPGREAFIVQMSDEIEHELQEVAA